jgi:hypothetical protein
VCHDDDVAVSEIGGRRVREQRGEVVPRLDVREIGKRG